MKLYGGVDGGQSSTTAVIADETGRILGRGTAGPSDEVGQGKDSTRMRDAFAAALRDSLQAARLNSATQFESVIAGLSGYEGSLRGAPPAIFARRFSLVHDVTVAHAAAFDGGAGVVVVAGTGSVAYGRNEAGETCRAGGWGYLFGDGGSAFWMGRRLLERAMHDEDYGLISFVTPAVLEHFHRKTIREISQDFYRGIIDRPTLAALASTTITLAKDGMGDALLIVDQAADALASLGALCARRLHGNTRILAQSVPIAFTGGLTADDWFLQKVYAQLHDRLPESTVVQPARAPAEGALLLAYRAAGADPLPELHG